MSAERTPQNPELRTQNSRPRTIKALVFDFDGLILETESPDYQAWRELYAEHGQEMPLSLWAECIGRSIEYFDAIAHLEGLTGRPLDDREAVETRRHRRYVEMVEALPVLPGVTEYIAEAQRLGLKLAVASSSSRAWVSDHLTRLGLHEHWHSLHCRDDVAQGKPDPALYLAAVESLGVAPHEAIAFEDSPNGVRAAKAAGLYCVAVPNSLTADLDLSLADLRLNSLADMPLTELIATLERQSEGQEVDMQHGGGEAGHL